jgi:hypothetical protein
MEVEVDEVSRFIVTHLFLPIFSVARYELVCYRLVASSAAPGVLCGVDEAERIVSPLPPTT